MLRCGLAVLAYLVPTFALGYSWHLILFKDSYAALAMYRAEVIVPFGFVAILIQGGLFAWIYGRTFAGMSGPWLLRGLAYAALGGVLSWTYTTLSVAAKNVMTSVPHYLLIETAFTAVQWIMVGPLTALAFTVGAAAREPVAA